ncbi:MAG TPA: EpsD family peptidyl-prolyl cis-trans isomerase [Methylobacter sp.]|jgi:EpsD family peptidyl-prolyl cis-trans isomerase
MHTNSTKRAKELMSGIYFKSVDKRHAGRNLANSVLALSMLIVAGCDKELTEKQSTQVAAKVNDSEITIHQVNEVIKASGVSGSEADAPRKALDTLIDQELLVQKALSNQLDRDPETMMTLENAQRQILTQSYVQRQVLNPAPVSAQDKQEYYQQHPDLFAKRRIYQFQLFNLETPQLDPALNASLDQASSPEQVRKLLKQYQVKFQEETVTKPAEQLPLEMLSAFANAKVGDILIAPQTQSKQLLMQVINFAEHPVSLEQAQVQIEKLLVNTRNKQILDEHLKQLHAAATIVYQGDFAKQDKADKAIESAQAEQQSVPPADTKPDRNIQKILEQGLSGIK